MDKKKKFLLESITRNLEEIRKQKEANKAALSIRKLVLAFQNGYLTEGEFGNQIADIVLYQQSFKALTLMESCEHTLIVSKDMIEEQ